MPKTWLYKWALQSRATKDALNAMCHLSEGGTGVIGPPRAVFARGKRGKPESKDLCI
jgi:hypothetical protein